MNAQRRQPEKKLEPVEAPEPEEKEHGEEQTITLDAKNRTVEVAMRGKDGLVLLKAIAFFVVASSIGILLYCLAYLIESIGTNLLDSVGIVVWMICLFGSACFAHWPQ